MEKLISHSVSYRFTIKHYPRSMPHVNLTVLIPNTVDADEVLTALEAASTLPLTIQILKGHILTCNDQEEAEPEAVQPMERLLLAAPTVVPASAASVAGAHATAPAPSATVLKSVRPAKKSTVSAASDAGHSSTASASAATASASASACWEKRHRLKLLTAHKVARKRRDQSPCQ